MATEISVAPSWQPGNHRTGRYSVAFSMVRRHRRDTGNSNLYSVNCLIAAIWPRPVKPESFRMFRGTLAACTVFLSIILISDSVIILAALFAGSAAAMSLLAGTTSLFVATMLVVIIVALPLLFRQSARSENHDSNLNLPQDEDREVIARIESVMADTQIYRDPNLTLARLGRRLHCPARAVSIAVNRCTGENVSRYINAFRVQLAARLLETSDLSVTEVMLEAGFQSKSTFNTEFRLVLGSTPTEYRKARQAV